MPTTYPELARETACAQDAGSSLSLHERKRNQAAGTVDPLGSEPRTYPHHSNRDDPGVRLLRRGRAGGEDVGRVGARGQRVVSFPGGGSHHPPGRSLDRWWMVSSVLSRPEPDSLVWMSARALSLLDTALRGDLRELRAPRVAGSIGHRPRENFLQKILRYLAL